MLNYSSIKKNESIKVTTTEFSKNLEIRHNGLYRLKVEFFYRHGTEMMLINNLNENVESEIEVQEIEGVNLFIIKPKGWNIKIDVLPNKSDFRITFNNKSYLESIDDNFIFYFDGLHI